MKLKSIHKEHIIKAAEKIDRTGIPEDNLNNNYWVELTNGKEYPFKFLTQLAFHSLVTNQGQLLDFESNQSYRKYISDLGFKINYYNQGLPFFKESEIDHFGKNAGAKYRKSDNKNIADSKLLLPLVKKLNIWAKNSLLEDFQYKKDHGWQWSGTFKKYLWIRIFRKDSSKKVFFVLVIDSKGFYFKLDCLRSNHTQGTTEILSQEQRNKFDNYLSRVEVNYKEGYISKEKIENYNWDTLIALTRQYISQYASTFDDLEKIVTETTTSQKPSNKLHLRNSLKRIKSKIPKKRTYQGRKVNWVNKQQVSSRLGMNGEQLVVEYEKRKLITKGLPHLAEKVRKMLDGEGYDILSFDANGDELYLEVKTTTGSIEEPFFMSINEKDFMSEHQKKYYLYRLYNYSFSQNSADLYIMDYDELKKLDFLPISYEVSLENSTE